MGNISLFCVSNETSVSSEGYEVATDRAVKNPEMSEFGLLPCSSW